MTHIALVFFGASYESDGPKSLGDALVDVPKKSVKNQETKL